MRIDRHFQSSNTRSQTSFVFDLTQCPSPPLLLLKQKATLMCDFM
nr:MAG TPA: hypothetical protein [Caudoviricetes sp.]